MKKAYKACSPTETIEKIGGLLKTAGIDWRFEHEVSADVGDFYSCRVMLAPGRLSSFSIGSNGKGRSKEYARASALAELMERLQNNVLFYTAQQVFYKENATLAARDASFFNLRQTMKNHPGFTYAPDELYITEQGEVERLIRCYIKASTPDFFIRHFKDSGLHTVPFCHLGSGTVQQLPIEPIFLNTGTNGMCAGNSPREAILQGICEIFERYAMRRLYLENLRFPTIPRSYFDGTKIGEEMDKAEREKNWQLVVKDCSCGLGIPVIGLLIIDRAQHRYQFRMGADTRVAVALERCLTELYQGVEHIKMLDIDLEEQVAIIEKREDNNKALRYILYRPENAAKHPASLFAETPSYPFEGYSDEWGQSDEKDLNMVKDLLRKRGLDIYVRDVSFLGFPAYWVYIPGMSEVNNLVNVEYLALTRERQQHFRTAHHLNDATEREYYGLAQNIMSCYHQSSTLFTPNEEDVWNHGNSLLLQALISYRGGMAEDAVNILTHAGRSAKTGAEKLLYACLLDMLRMPQRSYGAQFIAQVYPEKICRLAEQCLHGDLHRLFKIGTCFDCESCPISAACRIQPYLELYHKLCEQYRLRVPNQQLLSDL